MFSNSVIEGDSESFFHSIKRIMQMSKNTNTYLL